MTAKDSAAGKRTNCPKCGGMISIPEPVYDAIEDELRSQYLLAYLSDAPQASEIFRTVEVKVKGRLKARTISGYYP